MSEQEFLELIGVDDSTDFTPQTGTESGSDEPGDDLDALFEATYCERFEAGCSTGLEV
jgi:hypothetical protein